MNIHSFIKKVFAFALFSAWALYPSAQNLEDEPASPHEAILHGGLSYVLEIDFADLFYQLTRSPDKYFDQAINYAVLRKDQDTEEGFVNLFVTGLEKARSGEEFDSPNQATLAYYFARSTKNTPSFRSPDSEFIDYLNDQVVEATSNSAAVLRRRFRSLGFSDAMLDIRSEQGRISFELRGVLDSERIEKLITEKGILEFRATHKYNDAIKVVERINRVVKKILERDEAPEYEPEPTAEESVDPIDPESPISDTDELFERIEAKEDVSSNVGELSEKERAQEYPFIQYFTWTRDIDPDRPLVGYVKVADTFLVNEWLHHREVKPIIPTNMKLLWEQKPDENLKTLDGAKLIGLIAVRTNYHDKAPLDGSCIVKARQEFDTYRGDAPVINLTMNSKGSADWARMTKENVGKCIAIIIDNEVYSYPKVNEPITGGRTQISGSYTVEEARDMANVLSSGAMPVRLNVIERKVVGKLPSGSGPLSTMMIIVIALLVALLSFAIMRYGFAKKAALPDSKAP